MNAIAMRLVKMTVVALAAGAVFCAMWLHYRPEEVSAALPRGNHPQGPASGAVRPGAGDANHELLVLEAAARKKPDHAPVLFKLAALAESTGRHADARKYLEQILSREPQNLDARIELGKTMLEAGDVAGALEQTRLVLKSRPAHPDALYNLGAIYANIGNERLAREQWSRLAATNPSSESGRRAKQSLEQLRQDSGK